MTDKTRTTRNILKAGIIGAIIILIAGAFIAGSIGASGKSLAGQLNGSAAAAGAISDYTTQAATDSNIYQQQVSALWATKDLLKVVADQTANVNVLGSNLEATQTALVWTQIGVMALLVALIGIIAAIGLRFLDLQRVTANPPVEDTTPAITEN